MPETGPHKLESCFLERSRAGASHPFPKGPGNMAMAAPCTDGPQRTGPCISLGPPRARVDSKILCRPPVSMGRQEVPPHSCHDGSGLNSLPSAHTTLGPCDLGAAKLVLRCGQVTRLRQIVIPRTEDPNQAHLIPERRLNLTGCQPWQSVRGGDMKGRESREQGGVGVGT